MLEARLQTIRDAILFGHELSFEYNDKPRLIKVELVKTCKNGKMIMVGKTIGITEEYKSFDIAKITNMETV